MTPEPARRPNILLITADQWRADAVGFAGNDVIRTPHIDALAADGTYFTRHYSCAAPCGPARASLLTGLYPHNHRSILNGTPLAGHLGNLALELRDAGYRPTLFGYTDTTPDPRELPPDDPALRSYEGVMKGFEIGARLPEDGGPWLAYLAGLGYDVPGPGLEIYDADPAFSVPAGRQPTFAPARYAAEHSETAWLADRALDHLARHDDAAPFCLHVSFLRPHPPFIAPPGYHDLYHPDEMTPPLRAADAAAEAAQHPFLARALERVPQRVFFNHGRGPAAALGEAEVRQIRATYYALISQLDAQIGRLVAALRDSGRYADTLIVLTSDHGEQLGDHHLFGKLGYFDQSFHIPLVVKPAGGGAPGRRVTALTESVDVMPTLLDLAGCAVPAQCDGRSLRPLLDGDTPVDWRSAAHWQFDFRDPVHGAAERHFGLRAAQCSLLVLRDESYKYVHFAGLPPLLFDLAADPAERHNLADEPPGAARARDCARAMLDWRMSHEFGALDSLMATPEGLIDGRSRPL